MIYIESNSQSCLESYSPPVQSLALLRDQYIGLTAVISNADWGIRTTCPKKTKTAALIFTHRIAFTNFPYSYKDSYHY